MTEQEKKDSLAQFELERIAMIKAIQLPQVAYNEGKDEGNTFSKVSMKARQLSPCMARLMTPAQVFDYKYGKLDSQIELKLKLKSFGFKKAQIDNVLAVCECWQDYTNLNLLMKFLRRVVEPVVESEEGTVVSK